MKDWRVFKMGKYEISQDGYFAVLEETWHTIVFIENPRMLPLVTDLYFPQSALALHSALWLALKDKDE